MKPVFLVAQDNWRPDLSDNVWHLYLRGLKESYGYRLMGSRSIVVLLIVRRWPLAEKPIGSIKSGGGSWLCEADWLGEEKVVGATKCAAAERLIDVYLEKGI